MFCGFEGVVSSSFYLRNLGGVANTAWHRWQGCLRQQMTQKSPLPTYPRRTHHVTLKLSRRRQVQRLSPRNTTSVGRSASGTTTRRTRAYTQAGTQKRRRTSSSRWRRRQIRRRSTSSKYGGTFNG
eukprot:131799_1